MEVLNIHGVGDVRVDPRNPPQPGDHDVVVDVKSCGICGSDLSYIKAGGINRPEGGVMPLGHEAAGEIAAVGRAVTGLSVGQRVVINPMETSAFIGNGGPEGAFSQQVLVTDVHVGQSLLPIPQDLPFDVAALTEPLAVALHGVNRAAPKPDEKVVVFGCGPIGLGMVLWLADRGVKDVVAIDIAPERLERALELGARATINPAVENLQERLIALHGGSQIMGRPVAATDVYLDAAGAPNILSDTLSLGKVHARLVVTAVYMKPVQIDLNTLLMNEMSITTAIGYPTEMPEVLAALPRLKDKATKLISHRFGFENILEALSVASTSKSAKVMIEFDSQK